jgi:hypothetical protein
MVFRERAGTWSGQGDLRGVHVTGGKFNEPWSISASYSEVPQGHEDTLVGTGTEPKLEWLLASETSSP